MNVEKFRRYLEDQGLQPRSVRVYVYAAQLATRRSDPVGAVREAKSAGRRTQIRGALRHYAKWVGGDEGQAILQELEDLPRPRTRTSPPRRPLTNEEWRALMDHARNEVVDPLASVLVILYSTGLRSSDILDIERGRATEGLRTGILYLRQKGGGYRPFPIDGEIREALEALQAYDWEVLREVVSKPGSSDSAAYTRIRREVKAAAVEVGIPPDRVSPHTFRITAAVQLLRRTKDIVRVSKWLGHKDVTTTYRYLRYIDEGELLDSWRELVDSRKEAE